MAEHSRDPQIMTQPEKIHALMHAATCQEARKDQVHLQQPGTQGDGGERLPTWICSSQTVQNQTTRPSTETRLPAMARDRACTGTPACIRLTRACRQTKHALHGERCMKAIANGQYNGGHTPGLGHKASRLHGERLCAAGHNRNNDKSALHKACHCSGDA